MYRLMLYHRFRWILLAYVTIVLITIITPVFVAEVPVFILGIALLVSAVYMLTASFLVWLYFRVRYRLRTLRGRGVVLCYAASLKKTTDWRQMLTLWECTLDELTKVFGFSPKRRVVLYAVPSLKGWYGHPHPGALALVGADAVLLEPRSLGRFVVETARHELTHLFAWHWSKARHSFQIEGFATCLQQTLGGRSIDAWAADLVRRKRFPLLPWLLEEWKSDDPHRGSFYVIAGSFTRFLIEEFGWESYREFYRRAHRSQFAKCFRTYFGLSLVSAEELWRRQLLPASAWDFSNPTGPARGGACSARRGS